MISRFLPVSKTPFKNLTEQQILALAISSEEDDARIYRTYADGLKADFPDTATIFEEMAEEACEPPMITGLL